PLLPLPARSSDLRLARRPPLELLRTTTRGRRSRPTPDARAPARRSSVPSARPHPHAAVNASPAASGTPRSQARGATCPPPVPARLTQVFVHEPHDRRALADGRGHALDRTQT